jgi:hypothetical protein
VDDFGLTTWKAVLDRIGTPYDVHLPTDGRLSPSTFVGPDGVGRYNAILLTSSTLLAKDGQGRFASTLDTAQWQALWDYERTFGVRQVALNAAPGTNAEDQCLRGRGEGAAKETDKATLSSAGAAIFSRLRSDAQIPLGGAYIYRTMVDPSCRADPILMVGTEVLGVVSTTPDGRERVAIAAALGPDQLATNLLGYGLVRWATRGVFLGEERQWINVDVDDWFLTTLRRHPDGSTETYRLTGPEAESVARQQKALRDRHPAIGGFQLNMAFNGGLLDSSAPAECRAVGAYDALSSYSRCLANEFRWINHTMHHPQMNTTDYNLSRAEIADNLAKAAKAGIPAPSTVLKTPEYSGLGVYVSPPDSENLVDHGLEGSNAELLRAASDAGVKYLHGNMSFVSHRPNCFNCGVYHPLQPNLFVVPDWPTNIAFEASTPEEETALYNGEYGTNGTLPGTLGEDRDYQQIIDAEADVALQHIASGSAYTHTLHQGNLHEYAPDRSLMYDWLDAVFARYDSYYTVPLDNPDWTRLAEYVEARNAHFAELAAHRDAIWDRTAGTVTYTAKDASRLFLTGLATRAVDDASPAVAAQAERAAPDQPGVDTAENYGDDTVSSVQIDAGQTAVFAVK